VKRLGKEELRRIRDTPRGTSRNRLADLSGTIVAGASSPGQQFGTQKPKQPGSELVRAGRREAKYDERNNASPTPPLNQSLSERWGVQARLTSSEGKGKRTIGVKGNSAG